MRYIGCKQLLLEDIEKVIDENVKAQNAEVFCDIFSGTACCANYFKKKYKIISNDILYFSYVIQKAKIENSGNLTFSKSENPIEYFNSLKDKELEQLPKEKRFCQNNYSPLGKRMYLSEKNALKIDFIRNKIEEWRKEINENEYFYLLASLIEAIPFVSNISGTFGAYNKFWDKRSLKDIKLKEIEIVDNEKDNRCYNENANDLIKKISGDILYIDPPYNSRQYSQNYHLLEAIAKYDFPLLKGITGQPDYKGTKSRYCQKAYALNELKDLIKNAKFEHIILSYSTEGLIPQKEIEKALNEISREIKIYEIPYKRFKSRETNKDENLKELIFYAKKEI